MIVLMGAGAMLVFACSSPKDILKEGGIRDEVDASYVIASSGVTFLDCLKELGVATEGEGSGTYFAILDKANDQNFKVQRFIVSPNNKALKDKFSLCDFNEPAVSRERVYEAEGDFPTLNHSMLRNPLTQKERPLPVKLTPIK